MQKKKAQSKQSSGGKSPARYRNDSFEAVAKRLGCDPDMDKFLKKLGRIARAKPKAKPT